MTEIRCVKCNRLLMKDISGLKRRDFPLPNIVEVKCSKCGLIQSVCLPCVKEGLEGDKEYSLTELTN